MGQPTRPKISKNLKELNHANNKLKNTQYLNKHIFKYIFKKHI